MEPKPIKPESQGSSSFASSSASGQANAKVTKPLTAQLLSQLIHEFRQLQLEVAELKASDQHMEEVKDEEGAFRYQLYFRDGYEQPARKILAEGLVIFLEEQSQTWRVKNCSFAIIKPDEDEGGWGALRLDVAVNSVSGLIKIRKVMKKQMDLWTGPKNRIRTRKPTNQSKLYSKDAEAQWQGSLRDAIDLIKGEGING